MRAPLRARRAGSGLDVRAWPVRSAPRPLLAVALVVELVAVASVVASALVTPLSAHACWVTLFLVGVAVAFEEIASRAARLRLRLSAELKQDMVSVWALAGALALPPAGAAILVASVLGYTWFRQERPAGQALYRKVFNSANTLASTMAAAAAFRGVRHWLGSDVTAWALAATVAAVTALLTFAVVNRLVATCALRALRVPLRGMLGTRDDNLVELATLCLGALVALAVVHEPLLAVLVLAPLVTLQRGALVRELEAAATTDAKTGLLNAVAWEQVAAREVTRAGRDHTWVSVLIIDVDHFKRVNDRFGHLAGDSVLRLIGKALQTAVREYDSVARFGGEEFVAVLPEASADTAVVVAERLRTRINELWVSQVVDGLAPENDELLAVSIGVAAAFDGAADVQQLLYEADGALYRAKESGRNRVVLAGDTDTRAAQDVWLPIR